MKILEKNNPFYGLTYDDVGVYPKYRSTINKRSECSVKSKLTKGIFINTPIIPANMLDIVGPTMINVFNDFGAPVFIPRFLTLQERFEMYDVAYKKYSEDISHKNKSQWIVGFSIGVSRRDKDRFKKIFDFIHNYNYDNIVDKHYLFCIDVSNAWSNKCFKMIEWIKKQDISVSLIVGNIATGQAAWELYQHGVDGIKVGIGPGSLCLTREKTGIGVPQLHALYDVYSMINGSIPLIADGGINKSGDIVKALACGADSVMIGGLFAGTEETPGELKHDHSDNCEECEYYNSGFCAENCFTYKEYSGMASQKIQEFIGKNEDEIYVEGITKKVKYKGFVSPIIKDLIKGIESGMSFCNARNLKELRDNAYIIKFKGHSVHIENGVR